MNVLDWLFIGCLSVALLTFLAGILNVILFFNTSRQVKKLASKRPKNTKKKKRWQKVRRQLEKKKKNNIKTIFVFLFVTIVFTCAGAYARYYQMTNLSTEDGNAIIQSYFLTGEVEKSLMNIQDGADSGKTQATLADRASLLASYGSSSPSDKLSKEGQQLLVRYYTRIREYSVNVYSLTPTQLKEPGTVTAYLEDLKQIQKIQTKIFKQFSIDQSSLRQKK